MHSTVSVGDRLRIRAPGGRFWFDGQSSKNVVLIAGGVGITPLMSMLRNLADQQWQGHIYFINAMRSIDDWIFEQEVQRIAQQLPGLHWVHCITRNPATERVHDVDRINHAISSNIQFRTGYVTDELIRATVPNICGMPIYLCGPSSMMESVTELLLQMGVQAAQIHREAFASPTANSDDERPSSDSSIGGQEVSVAATVEFAKSRIEASIDASQSILEVAEDHGVAIPSECRSGICGQCKVRCTSGRVSMEVTDALSSSEIRSGWILACQARATTAKLEIEA